MKLVRLVTEDDGFFKSSFGNEMTLKPNAKMCLLNLTFETAFDVITIDSNNSSISFTSDTSDATTTIDVKLAERVYNRDEVDEFYADLLVTLNSAISDVVGSNSIGSQFDIRSVDGLKQIEYRYSPFMNPMYLQNRESIMSLSNVLIDIDTTEFNTGGYFDLSSGGTWQQSGSANTLTFDTTDLGNPDAGVAYRRNLNGIFHYWKPTLGSSTHWKIFFSKPETAPFNNQLYADVQTDGSIILGGGAATYVPATTPLTFIESGGLTTIAKQDTQLDTDDQSANIITGIGRLCSGNGLLICRIKSSVTNGSGLEDNGFGIGLSKTPLTEVIVPGENIENTYRDFEVSYNRPLENYRTVIAGVGATTNTTPENVEGGDLYSHDVIYFKIADGILTAGILQDTGTDVRKGVVIEEFIDAGEIFYPYMYLRGDSDHIKIDMFNYTIDPWANQGFGINNEPPFWEVTGRDSAGNQHNAYTNGVQDVLDNGYIFDWPYGVAANFALPKPQNWDIVLNCQLTMPTEIWSFLGYGTQLDYGSAPDSSESKVIQIGQNVFRDCWSFFIPNTAPQIQLSDNFVVESLSLPLDTFDASKFYYGDLGSITPRPEAEKKGRRKNILMTIPVNDNTNGLVEYEANNLIFIDINNAQPLNVRNLNFRVLTKSFNQINQSGESAVMTILIDG